MRIEQYFEVEGTLMGMVYNSSKFEDGTFIRTSEIIENNKHVALTRSGSAYYLGEKSPHQYKGHIENYVFLPTGQCRGIFEHDVLTTSKVVYSETIVGLKLIRTESGSIYSLGEMCTPPQAKKEVVQKQGFIKRLVNKLALQ